MARKTATKSLTKSNPHGANQWLPDPRQKLCWDFYVDPKSESFANAEKSAIRASYSLTSAAQITTQPWFIDKTRRLGLLSKAERNLEEAMDLPPMTQAMSMFGPIFEKKEKKVKVKTKSGKSKTKIIKENGAPVMKYNSELLKVKLDASKFVAERVGKAMYGKDDGGGGNIFNIVVFNDEQRRAVAERIIARRSSDS